MKSVVKGSGKVISEAFEGDDSRVILLRLVPIGSKSWAFLGKINDPMNNFYQLG